MKCILSMMSLQASGLAAGKGVVVPSNKEESLLALKQIMKDREFGDAGNEVRMPIFKFSST